MGGRGENQPAFEVLNCDANAADDDCVDGD